MDIYVILQLYFSTIICFLAQIVHTVAIGNSYMLNYVSF